MRSTLVAVVLGALFVTMGACSSSSSGGGNGATGGTGAVAGGGGSGGSGGTSSGGLCATACGKAASANCSQQSQCAASCQQTYTTYPSCKSQIDAYLNCAMTNGTWKCSASGVPQITDPNNKCTSQQTALTTCISSGTGGGTGTGGAGTGGAGTGGGSSVTLPAGCVNPGTLDVQCNPVTNEGCTGSGEACDIGTDSSGNPSLGCFPPPNDVTKGGTCSNSAGPYCQAKLHCDEVGDAASGTCKPYCCSNSDCAGGTCTPFDSQQLGTLGVCN